MKILLGFIAFALLLISTPVQAAEGLQGAASAITSSTEAIRQMADQASSTLAKAKEIADTVSTTAKTATEAYGKFKGVITAVTAVFERGQQIYDRLQPAIHKVANIWIYLSNNNNPERVLVLVGAIILVVVILRHI